MVLKLVSLLTFMAWAAAASANTTLTQDSVLGNTTTKTTTELDLRSTRYGLSVINNAEIIFTTVPLEGIKCGYEGNTNEACASLFHLYSEQGMQLDFDEEESAGHGRDLQQQQISAQADIDFAVSAEPVITTNADVKNYPFFVYGVAPAFHVPGVSKLVLSKLALAKIFRGCEYVNTSSAPTTSSTASPTTSPSANTTFAPTAAPSTSSPNTNQTHCRAGSITRWDDEEILKTNPVAIHGALREAGKIKVIVPGELSPKTPAFKRALSRFDPIDFALQIGQEKDVTWRGTEFESVGGSFGPLRRVSQTPGSITFDTIHQVLLQANVHVVDLIVSDDDAGDSTVVVSPNTKSLYAAFFEVGLAFGNDGSAPSEMIVDLTVAKGIHSWPIALLAYLSTRPESTPPNCLLRKSSGLSFMQFVYENQGEESMVFDQGLASLTNDAADELLAIFRDQLSCDGVRVYTPPPAPPTMVVFSGDSLHALLSTFLRTAETSKEFSVSLQQLPTHVALREYWTCISSNSSACDKEATDLLVIADDNLSQYILSDVRQSKGAYELFSMPYVAVATGFIYNFCKSIVEQCDYRSRAALVLDVATAANILDGKIVWWNDPAIAALNPARKLPNERIIVIAGPKYTSYHLDFVQNIRNTYVPDFAYRAGDGITRDTFLAAWMDVSLTPYSFSFVVFNSTVMEGVERVTLRNARGADVAATPESIEACAMDTYDAETNMFHLSNSLARDCYPLVKDFNIFVANPLIYTAPAMMLQTLYEQAVREKQGRTSVYSNGFGTLLDLNVSGVDLQQRNFVAMEGIVQIDTGLSVLRVHHELNLIPQGAIQAMYAVMGLELAFFSLLACWTVYNRNRKLIRNSSPLFMLQVLFGAAVMAATVIPLSFQDDYLVARATTPEELAMLSNPVLDLACVINPILFSMGFFIAFSAIFLKTWRLIRIFNNVKLKNLFLRDRQLMLYQIAVVLFTCVLNALWAGVDPMVWLRTARYVNGQGLVIGSTGVCYSRGGVASAMPLFVGIVLILVVGNYLAYLGRRIPTEFNESKWTAMAMMVILEAFVIAVPVLVLSNDEPVPGFIIKSLVALLVAGATVGLIFVPKLMLAYGIGENKDTSNPWRFVRASDSSNNTKNSKKVAQQQDAMISQIVGVTAQSTTPNARSAHLPNRLTSQQNYPSPSKSTSEALARILQDDPSRRKFRRFLKTLKMEENVRFWDATMIIKAEQNENKRYAGTRAVIQSFVSDNSPFQVNLSSATKKEIMTAYDADDKAKLRDPAFFDKAMAEMFDDLRQSDAFRAFMENDTFSTQNLA